MGKPSGKVYIIYSLRSRHLLIKSSTDLHTKYNIFLSTYVKKKQKYIELFILIKNICILSFVKYIFKK